MNWKEITTIVCNAMVAIALFTLVGFGKITFAQALMGIGLMVVPGAGGVALNRMGKK